MFEFNVPKIIYGVGVRHQAAEHCVRFGKKALIVCDPFVTQQGWANALRQELQKCGIASDIYDGVVPNPTTVSIDKGVEFAKQQKCDFMIGYGGGSSMDTAKAIAVGATHDGPIWDYAIGEKKITDATLPVVAITTTSGTGSQCTIFSVITNPKTKQKPGMGSPYILPKLAVVDPELTLTVPPKLTFETGFDIFSHAVEAYTSKIATPMSDLHAEKAIQLVCTYLPVAYKDGANLQARCQLSLADTYAGIAINHGCVSLGHVIAHVISGHLPSIAHGGALFSVYKGVLALNAKAMPEKHAYIRNCLNKDRKDVASAFDAFFAQFDYQRPLVSELKKNPSLIELFAKECFTYMKGVADLNPIEASVADVEKILRDCI